METWFNMLAENNDHKLFEKLANRDDSVGE